MAKKPNIQRLLGAVATFQHETHQAVTNLRDLDRVQRQLANARGKLRHHLQVLGVPDDTFDWSEED